ncbi:hypothetical protein SPB21_03880 [Leptothoe sp. ISB3NOV94-8A]|uniref:Uncharacterized protein n=1 Tax=Adonisia turfae CCMR0081 TaxID=2292702 RepID=A0A6M0RR83_9CYAN|nr:hypothetical protein [Adonisia turfae]NEZ58774.1 hypothetical protein [Adonisia turfae CCMR0081]
MTSNSGARRASEIATLGFWLLATAVLGVVLLLNLQPWFALGVDYMSQIDKGILIRFADWLIGGRVAKVLGLIFLFAAARSFKKKPWLAAWLVMCGIVLLLSANTLVSAIGELVGFVFWSWIQIIQVAPMICQYSIAGRNRSWMEGLRQYRNAAYLVEAIACFIKYPPYAGGDTSRLLSDLTTGFYLDASLWNWGNFFWAIATMAAVELTLHFLLKAAVAIRVTRVMAEETA